MSVPVDPAQFLIAAAIMVPAVYLTVKTGLALFAFYLLLMAGFYREGYRVLCYFTLVLGGMALGALGWMAFQGLMALVGWLL